MRQHKLHLDHIAVESFATTRENRPVGTVNGHDADTELCTLEACDGSTYIVVCVSCPTACTNCLSACPPYTCENTCPPKHTCEPQCGATTVC